MKFPTYFTASTTDAAFGPPVAVERNLITRHSWARFWPTGAGGIDPEGRVWLHCQDKEDPWEPVYRWVRMRERPDEDFTVKP